MEKQIRRGSERQGRKEWECQPGGLRAETWGRGRGEGQAEEADEERRGGGVQRE